MEENACDVDHLDSDVLLPPRKRLLAGLKKHSDVNPCTSSPPVDDIMGFEFDIRLNNLLKFHSDDCNRSIEEIAEASKVAAVEAVKLAKVARAIAEEKAAKATEAMAAAKSAIKLVDTISDEVMSRDKYSKKNKMKKHVPVQMLYKGTKNCKTDEDLAQTLNRTINSSPRISKNSTSDSRNHNHKRVKVSSTSEDAKHRSGSTSREGNRSSTSDGVDIAEIKLSNGLSQEKELIRLDSSIAKLKKAGHRKMENGESSQSVKADCLNMENGKGEPMNSKEKFGESADDTCNIGKKRGRMKQKKDMNSKSSSSATASKASACVKQ